LRHTENSSLNDKSGISSLGRDSTLSSVYNFPALSKSPSWLPPVKYALPESNRYETNVTTIDNGLRVCIFVLYKFSIWLLFFCVKIASEKLFGDFCTVGGICKRYLFLNLFIKFFVVIISAGPRFEGKYISGVSHFLEKLAFMVKRNNRINLKFLFEIFSQRKNIKIGKKLSIHYMK